MLFGGACAHFRTGSFATGVALVDAIGAVADAAGHHPDVDLRYGGVTVRPITHEVDGLSERDVGAGGPGRPPRPRAFDLVPGHGRAPPAAQPQPRRYLRAARLDY